MFGYLTAHLESNGAVCEKCMHFELLCVCVWLHAEAAHELMINQIDFSNIKNKQTRARLLAQAKHEANINKHNARKWDKYNRLTHPEQVCGCIDICTDFYISIAYRSINLSIHGFSNCSVHQHISSSHLHSQVYTYTQAPAPRPTRTIENSREFDETVVDDNDEEVCLAFLRLVQCCVVLIYICFSICLLGHSSILIPCLSIF
jgi:hypothetical protein